MIEVFKTNITEESTAMSLLQQLMSHLPESIINFDLEDCDNILRIENCKVESHKVVQLVTQHGFYCEVLE